MIDLHTHSVFSDGELIPAELVRRAEHLGLTTVGITDHVDSSNVDFIVPRICKIAEELNQTLSINVVPGVEITHVPPSLIAAIVTEARKLGARLILVHGETVVEPVAPGTNLAALNADIDILAHPGLISRDEAEIACEKNIFLEISARKGHSLTNGHVAKIATETGVKLVVNTDAHAPGDMINREMVEKVVQGAGLSKEAFFEMQQNALTLCERIR
jgi:putative hydrolase